MSVSVEEFGLYRRGPTDVWFVVKKVDRESDTVAYEHEYPGSWDSWTFTVGSLSKFEAEMTERKP